jgi:hypothetical protein
MRSRTANTRGGSGAGGVDLSPWGRQPLNDEWDVSRVILKRQGVFGNYQLIGLLHGNEDGDRAWHVKQINENPVRNYWVQDGKVFALRIDGPLSEPINSRLERGNQILDMSEDESRMILNAIATWEAEEHE